MFGSNPFGKSFPDLPQTPANAQLYDAGMMVVSQKLGRKYTVYPPSLEPGTCGVRIKYAIRSPTAASFFIKGGTVEGRPFVCIG